MNIVITGTSRGIGYNIAKYFLEKGHTVAGIARAEQKEKFIHCPGKFYPVILDMENIRNNTSMLFDTIHASMNSVDILINNAGILLKKILFNAAGMI